MNDVVLGATPGTETLSVTPRGANAALESWWVPASPPRLAFAGEVDLMTIHEFEAVFRGVLGRHHQFAVDLRGLQFISSRGIGTMLGHHDRIVEIWVYRPGPVYRALTQFGFPSALITPTPATRSPGQDLRPGNPR